MTMRHCRTFLLLWAAAALAQDPTFRSTVPLVLVPVTVTDSKGRYIDGLGAGDFKLLDNGVTRRLELDTAESVPAPVALVIAVQANDLSAAAMLKIRKTGSMIQPLITGEHGHAAVLSYGERVQVLQDFTSDAQKIQSVLGSIRPDAASTARTLDAAAEAAAMPGRRPNGERRILLLMGESKDRGSETRLSDVVMNIQRLGITVYPATFSAWMTPFTTKASELPRAGGGAGGLLAGLSELVRLGKVNAAATLAHESGGRVLSFTTLHGLEQLLTRVGEEVHGQYLISAPAMNEPEGFHTLQVIVPSRGDAVVHARPDYWVVR